MTVIAEWEQRLLAAVEESQDELLALAGLLIRTRARTRRGTAPRSRT